MGWGGKFRDREGWGWYGWYQVKRKNKEDNERYGDRMTKTEE